MMNYTSKQLTSLIDTIKAANLPCDFLEDLEKATPTKFQHLFKKYFGNTVYNLIYNNEINKNIGLYITTNNIWLQILSEWRLKN